MRSVDVIFTPPNSVMTAKIDRFLNGGQKRIEVPYLHLILVLFILVSGVNADFVF